MFIDIYIHDDIQSEFIVWNKQYRETLLKYMRSYFDPQIQQLIQFVSEEFEFVRVPGNLPLYTEKITKVVKYDKLDKEMKIGRFYARMWVKNASSIQMTNDELNEFYLKVDSQIRSCVNSDLINDSKENIQDTIERFVLCTKIIMKLNDVFKYKKMIDYDYLDKVIEIEQDYQCNHSIWELITSTFEMIRKALKWDDLFEPEFHKLAQKVSKIFKIINERINQYGLSLVMAEALSELINITNILLNAHPSWIVEG